MANRGSVNGSVQFPDGPAAVAADQAPTMADLMPVYSALATRRATFDSLMWQTPALALTAQAFLFTISLSPSSADVARYIASALDIITAVVAIQTMAKHRYNELTDSLLLEDVERQLRIIIRGVHPHARPDVRGSAVGNEQGPLCRRKSFRLWYLSLGGFGVAAGVVIVLTALAPQLFSN